MIFLVSTAWVVRYSKFSPCDQRIFDIQLQFSLSIFFFFYLFIFHQRRERERDLNLISYYERIKKCQGFRELQSNIFKDQCHYFISLLNNLIHFKSILELLFCLSYQKVKENLRRLCIFLFVENRGFVIIIVVYIFYLKNIRFWSLQ